MINDIKNANGKLIGNVKITEDSIIVNTFSKQDVVVLPITILKSDNIFKLLYDEYYLSISEIASILNISYYAANKLFKQSSCTTNKNENRRNRAFNTAVSSEQSAKMTQALVGRVSPTFGTKLSNDTKSKISQSLSELYINNPDKINNGFGYTGYFNSVKFNKRLYFRSLLELYVFIQCENNNSIVSLDSECIRIPYILNNITRNYIPDLIINNKYLVEIKPERFLEYRPNLYAEFNAKCKAAIQYSNVNGLVFKLVFDTDINYNSYDFKKYLKSNINNYSIVFNKSVDWLSN